ncbi:MAG TPA: tetratricopeptide repeat protein [Longimicrobiales bacterium]|nr:tetratricopeptide repeat protein [Longimicrobiales bacterium]
MNRGKGIILALTMAALTACASGGGGAEAGVPDTGGADAPGENQHTQAATVAIVQASGSEGDAAQQHYQTALSESLAAIEMEPTNARGYLLAGQAAVGLNDFVQADTMFDRAEELYPPYSEQTIVDREMGWVNAYSLGVEAANAGDVEGARDIFRGAADLYDQRPDAHMMVGWSSIQLGDEEGAVVAYREALDILYGDPPEGLNDEQLASWDDNIRTASLNLAQMLAQTGNPAEAADVLARLLDERGDTLDDETVLQATTARANFLAEAGQTEEAQALMDEILARPDLTSDDFFQLGIGYFNAGDYAQAAEAFSQAAELNPYNRDALLNLVQSLYSRTLELEEEPASSERDEQLFDLHQQILETAEQVRSFDPLNRNVLSFMLRSYRGQADLADDAEAQRLAQASQTLFREYQAQTFEVSDISLSLQQGNTAELTGVLTNLAADPGSQVSLRFSAVNTSGQELDGATVQVSVPETGEAVQFSTSLDLSGGDFGGWMYEVVE